MSALSEQTTVAVRAVLAPVERDVPVLLELGPAAIPVTLLTAGGGELDQGALTHDVLEAVCGLSERVTLTVTEHSRAGPWPRTTIGPGLTYLGMPAGYELTTLVHAIREAGRLAPALSVTSQERLASLERDVSLAVYVTPT